MTSGESWQLKNAPAQSLAAAQDAARKACLSLGEWLDSVVVEAPESQLIENNKEKPLNAAESARDLMAALGRINHRLDDIDQRGRHASEALEQRVDSVGRALASLARERAAVAVSGTVAPGRPSGDWAFSLDDAVAEISERQRELDEGAEMVPERFVPPAYRAARDEVAGLGDKLKELTARLEQMQRPCRADDAVAPLRQQLAEINRVLQDALPRQAIEALEAEIRKLAERIDASRVDNTPALAGIERSLAEVREALRALTPAESLAGFSEGVSMLSRKIEAMTVAGYDPAAIQQLETAISGLRTVLDHVASGEALAELAREVRGLADRIDRLDRIAVGGADQSGFLEHLEQRIGAIAEALETRHTESGPATSPKLEAAIEALTRKIELLQASRDSDVGQVEHRIDTILQRLESSETRFGRIDVIEHGLGEVLKALEEIRAGNNLRPAASQAVEALQRDLARTHDTLDSMHDTMSSMVGRLAMIETDIRRDPPSPPEPPPPPTLPLTPNIRLDAFGTQGIHRTQETQGTHGTPAAQAAPAEPARPAPSLRAVTDVAADLPLEPGSGPPTARRPPASAAERIAASEAVLIGDQGVKPSDQATKQNFILAARRAAQTAAGERPAGARIVGKPAAAEPESKLSQRMKSLFVGFSVIVIMAGVLRVALSLLEPSEAAVPPVPAKAAAVQPPAELPSVTLKAPPRPVSGFEFPTANDKPLPFALPATPERSSSLTPDDQSLFAPPSRGLVTEQPQPAPKNESKNEPKKDNNEKNDKTADVTGSITAAAIAAAPVAATAASPIVPAPAAAAPLTLPKLPATIGSKRLVEAAAKGDPGAAYEIGIRLAEGRGAPPSVEEAAIWLERAAQAGLAPAQFRLGSLYEKGQGVKKDLPRARELYLAAAGKGNAKAMHNLAVLYAEGFEGKPDYAAALQWFRKAAEFGVADSQYNLGVLFARGIGVQQNLSESYKWFALAALQGDQDAAKKRDDVAGRLDADALKAARQTVQSFTPDQQPDLAVNAGAPANGWDAAEPPAAAKSKAKRSQRSAAL
jgi:localization factor PodJL